VGQEGSAEAPLLRESVTRGVGAFGKNRLVDDLRPEDFQRLRAVLAASWGPVGLANEIQIVRSLFKYGFEAGLLDKPARFGPGFKKPSAKVLRMNRAKAGPRLFEREDLLKVLDTALPMRWVFKSPSRKRLAPAPSSAKQARKWASRSRESSWGRFWGN